MEYWHITLPITLVYIAVALGIGVMTAGKVSSKIESWAVSNREFGTVLMFFLLGAAAVSGGTYLGEPGWAYSTGVNIFYVTAYLISGYFTIYMLADKLWAVGNKFNYVTQANMFRHRFESRALGVVAGLVGIAGCIGYGIVQGMGIGFIMNFASGGLIPFWGGIALVFGVMAAYVSASGLRAIGWTNTVQGILMTIMAWVTGLMIIKHYTGGYFTTLFNRLIVEAPQYLTLQQSGWTYQYWTTAVIVSGLGMACWPTFTLGWWGAKSAKELKRSCAVTPLYWWTRLAIMCVGFAGVLAMPGVTPVDTITLKMALPVLPAWVLGFLLAAVLAATMSSAEILFLNAALQFVVDIVNPFAKLDGKTVTKWSRLAVIPFALLMFALSAAQPATLITVLLMTYGWLVQLFPIIIGTLYWKKATKYGALTGLITGTVMSILFTKVWPNLFGIHAGMWGLVPNTILFIVVSLMTQDRLPSQEILDGYFSEEDGEVFGVSL